MRIARRAFCLLLAACLTLTGVASAEAQGGGLADVIGDTVEDFSGFIDGMLGSAGDALGQAAGDVGDILSQAGGALGGAMGEVGTALDGVMSDVGTALDGVWANTSDALEGAWSWIGKLAGDNGEALRESARKALEELSGWLDIAGDAGSEALRAAYDAAAAEYGLVADKAAELWDALRAYAEEHDIDMAILVKLALAVIVRYSIGLESPDIARLADEYMHNEVEIIMGWFPSFGVDTELAAEAALELLEDALGD